MNPYTVRELQKINKNFAAEPKLEPWQRTSLQAPFYQRLTAILTRHCVGMDDHGPGVGPDGIDKHGRCDKCVEMRAQILAAL